MAGRLDTVLEAIYAAFAEGWTGPGGGTDGGMDVVRRDLTAEAMFMARLVTELLPEEPEALGLLALMLHAEARRAARRSAEGEFVPLAEQDPALWDAGMIDEAEVLLRRAGMRGMVGRYQLEGALQSAHVHRCQTGVANWAEVVALYDALFALSGSPVVAINRALAIAELRGRARRAGCAAGVCRPMRGWRSISRTGRRGQSCWRGRSAHARRGTRTRWRLAWSAMARYGDFCRGGRRR